MSRPHIVLDPEKHVYTVDGLVLPSVTHIIKETVPIPFNAAAWYGWKLGAHAGFDAARGFPQVDEFDDLVVVMKDTQHRPDRVLRTAGDRGTDVHRALELWADKYEPLNPMDFPPEDRPMIQGLARWLVLNEPFFLDSEIRTASKEHGYAGTLDAYVQFAEGEHKGKTARLDWKTGPRIYPDQHFPQIAAYDHAEQECGMPPVDICGIVHIPDSGKVKLIPSTDTFADFLVLLNHWRSIKRRKNGTP